MCAKNSWTKVHIFSDSRPHLLCQGLKDRIAILQVLERDALYGTLDLLYDGLLLTIIHV